MKTRHAVGALATDWIVACRSNEGPGDTLEDWICRAFSAQSAAIDKAGSVWVEFPAGGRWLDQAEISDLVCRIDGGV